MQWNRRAIVTSSVAAATAALALLGLLVATGKFNSVMSGTAISQEVVWAANFRGSDKRALTRETNREALLINPGAVPQWARTRLEHALATRNLGSAEFLWVPSLSVVSRWAHLGLAGIRRVTVRQEVPLPSISPKILDVAATEAHQWTHGPWRNQNAAYQLTHVKTTAISINLALSQELQSILPAGGTATVINRSGALVAAVANLSGPSVYWQSHPVGLGAVPPLLALALDQPQVARVMGQSQPSLAQIADTWGTRGIAQGLKALGFTQNSLPGQVVRNPPLSKVSAATFIDGKSLQVTSLELARSYAPFIDQGRLPHLTLLGNTVAGSQPRVGSLASLQTVFNEMPKVISNGIAFRVWRPEGNFAIVLDPSKGWVAVLEGPATQNTLAVVRALARQ